MIHTAYHANYIAHELTHRYAPDQPPIAAQKQKWQLLGMWRRLRQDSLISAASAVDV